MVRHFLKLTLYGFPLGPKEHVLKFQSSKRLQVCRRRLVANSYCPPQPPPGLIFHLTPEGKQEGTKEGRKEVGRKEERKSKEGRENVDSFYSEDLLCPSPV